MNILNTLKQGWCEMAIFALAFAGIGYLVPEIYYKNFDHTQYYTIQSVTVEGNKYNPGDEVLVEIHRKALITTSAVSVRELVLIKDNVEVARVRSDLAINANEDIIHAQWELPVNIKPGIYKFQGVVTYKFRGMDKTVEFFSSSFEVVKPTIL